MAVVGRECIITLYQQMRWKHVRLVPVRHTGWEHTTLSTNVIIMIWDDFTIDGSCGNTSSNIWNMLVNPTPPDTSKSYSAPTLMRFGLGFGTRLLFNQINFLFMFVPVNHMSLSDRLGASSFGLVEYHRIPCWKILKCRFFVLCSVHYFPAVWYLVVWC